MQKRVNPSIILFTRDFNKLWALNKNYSFKRLGKGSIIVRDLIKSRNIILSEGPKVEDKVQIANLMNVTFKENLKLAIWQEENGSARGQPFCWGRITRMQSNQMEIKLEYVKKARINQNNTVFILGYKTHLLCELAISKMGFKMLILPMPEELLKVEEGYLENKGIISQEDEKKFMIQRAEKRSVSEGNNFTQFRKTGLYDNKAKKFKLYDLSPNGLSFSLDSPEGFEVSDVIEILSINNKSFDPPLKGEIRSIKEIEDGKFKVGVMFKAYKEKKSA